jgi:primary-amine oxidase
LRLQPLLRLAPLCVLAALAAGPLGAQCLQPDPADPASHELTQMFPPGSVPKETGWKVTFGHDIDQGLFITGAFFKKGPQEPWMRVLWEARLADLFVPYHSALHRSQDLSAGRCFDLVPFSPVDLGPCGQNADEHVLKSDQVDRQKRCGKKAVEYDVTGPKVSYVVKEIRDRGMLWKCDQKGRRGYELILWGTLDAGNYNYLIQYGFRDDGTLTFRLGATGPNLPGLTWDGHMHNGLWRVDIDLNGFQDDLVQVHEHSENTSLPNATDRLNAFNGGTEGFLDWDDLKFTEINVRDTKTPTSKLAPDRRISYDFMLSREGTARHQEPYMQHDFWVSIYHPNEMDYESVPAYVKDQESLQGGKDVVLWLPTSAHHMVRREDGFKASGGWEGVAMVMWSGFDLRPRNLFAGTPLYNRECQKSP